MLIAKKITSDLVNRSLQESIYAVQCDSNTRAVEVTLTVDGTPWEPPAGTAVSVAFRKPDGNKGWYDQLPDGSSACRVAGNVVTAILAPEVLTAPGRVNAAIIFQDVDLNRISTFGFVIEVEPNAAAGNVISNSYYKYSTMAAVDTAIEAIENAIADLTGAVLCTEQTLTDEQQAQARENIGVLGLGEDLLIVTITQTSDGTFISSHTSKQIYDHAQNIGTVLIDIMGGFVNPDFISEDAVHAQLITRDVDFGVILNIEVSIKDNVVKTDNRYLVSGTEMDNKIDEVETNISAELQEIKSEQGKAYELIETITIEEETTQVYRTQEPDGTPLCLDSIQIEFLMKPGTANSALEFKYRTEEHPADLQFYMPNAIKNGIESRGVIWLFPVYNKLFGTYTPPQSDVWSNATWSTPLVRDWVIEKSPIVVWQLVGSTMPVGSVIKVWGVRA